jgi:Sulfatase
MRLFGKLEPLRPYLPWAALAALCVLFELPTMMRPDRLDPLAMRPTGEVVLLLTAYALCRLKAAPKVVYGILLVLTILLVVVRLDWAIYFLITRSEPLLYDQVFMLRHLLVLISDLWSVRTAAVLLGFVAACAGLVWAAARLLRAAEPLFDPGKPKRLAVVGASAWSMVVAGTLASKSSTPGDVSIHWVSADVIRNVRESRAIYADVERGVLDSPYRDYDQIRLRRMPNVSLLFIESYGRIVSDSDDLRPGWSERLAQMEARLGAAGWSAVSAYSTAPVSGGRSWLAVTSFLTGTRVQYEGVFRHMLDRMSQIPSLVKFLGKRGYHTIALEPSDRIRPGVEEVNYHGFARILRYGDMEYRGPKAGWGLVPDEYSLGFARARVLSPNTEPRFFQFHMVSSHMPWDGIPDYSGDWRSLNDAEGERVEATNHYNELVPRLSRYGREASRRWVFYGGLPDDYRARYLRTIEYDLRVIEEHLAENSSDDLVIVMGDHQPPAIAPEKTNFDVPVHVFARDPALLDEFRDRGFHRGLALGRSEHPALDHGGFFSLIVRALVRCCGDGASPPAYLMHGVPMGA